MSKEYVKVTHIYFDHWFWQKERERTRFINKQLHDEKRGQSVASLRFLKLRDEREIIKLEIKRGIPLITICEYNTYHSNTAASETVSEPGQTIGESKQIQDTDTNETNIRREKKEEELIKNIESSNTNETEDPVENTICTTLTYYQQNREQKRCLFDALPGLTEEVLQLHNYSDSSRFSANCKHLFSTFAPDG